MKDYIIVKCASCGTKNKIKIQKIQSSPKCGKCKEPIQPTKKPITAGDSDFDTHINTWRGLVMVDFWADWCGPCKMVSPIISELASENHEHLKVLKVNVDKNPMLASRYGIQGIPTIMLFKDGKKIDSISGAGAKQTYQNMINKYL